MSEEQTTQSTENATATETVASTEAAVSETPNNLLGETAEQQTQAESNTQRPEWLPEKFKTPEDFAKSYTELEKKLGTVPKAPDEYDYSFLKETTLNDIDEAQTGELTTMFKNLNLSQDQVKGVLGMYNDAIQEVQQQYQEQMQPQTDISVEQHRLKKMWGTDYDTNLQAVREVSNKLGKGVVYQPLTDTAEGMQLLLDYHNSNREANPISNTGTVTPVMDIKARISEMRADSKYRLPQGDALGDAHRAEIYRLYQLLDRQQG